MYFIIETQVNEDGSGAVVTPIQSRASRNEAEAVYHSILAAAAVSNVYRHGAAIIDEADVLIMHKNYKHTNSDEEGEDDG